MNQKFNPANAQSYFTAKFWRDHIFVGSDLQKKKAETVFQRRSVLISSVVCLTHHELAQLAGEVHNRQGEYANGSFHTAFTSKTSFDVWSRGGTRPMDQQSASLEHKAFKYGVQKQPDGSYRIHHFAG